MSQENDSHLPALCAAMQDSILLFGETIVWYLEMHLSDAMNNAAEKYGDGDESGAAYWNGRADICNTLITMLQPLSGQET